MGSNSQLLHGNFCNARWRVVHKNDFWWGKSEEFVVIKCVPIQSLDSAFHERRTDAVSIDHKASLWGPNYAAAIWRILSDSIWPILSLHFSKKYISSTWRLHDSRSSRNGRMCRGNVSPHTVGIFFPSAAAHSQLWLWLLRPACMGCPEGCGGYLPSSALSHPFTVCLFSGQTFIYSPRPTPSLQYRLWKQRADR